MTLILSWSTLYITFSKWKVSWILILAFRERSNHIASFVICHYFPKEHIWKPFFLEILGAPRKKQTDPVWSIFKMHSVPILAFLFWFATIRPKCICIFFSNSRCSAKELVRYCFSGGHSVYSVFALYIPMHPEAPCIYRCRFFILMWNYSPKVHALKSFFLEI